MDNVSTDVDETELTNFVKKNGIRVLSCHLVKPRRSRWQREAGITPEGRNTFRLCIPREQSGQLLKPDFWPSYITVSPWIFSKKQTETQTIDTPIVPSVSISSASASALAITSLSASHRDCDPERRESAIAGGLAVGGSVETNDTDEKSTSLLSASSVTGTDMETTLTGYYDC